MSCEMGLTRSRIRASIRGPRDRHALSQTRAAREEGSEGSS
jgi:hypothetical protein